MPIHPVFEYLLREVKIVVRATQTVEIFFATPLDRFLLRKSGNHEYVSPYFNDYGSPRGHGAGRVQAQTGDLGQGQRAKQASKVGVRQLKTTESVKLASDKEACVSGSRSARSANKHSLFSR